MITCFINNKELKVPEGTTVIQAIKNSGQEIAHYCWHPGLSVAGVCRLCMVEIEGQPKLQIACNLKVQEGMKVTNQSEKVKEAVRWGLDFHLINHPLDCPICDQAGECGLQDQYMKFGHYTPEMAEKKVTKKKVVDLGSKIVLDTERCILCSRCVRFTDEVSKTHELGIFNRGDRSEIGTFENRPLENNYSINTVDICPVGALTSKDFRFHQRVWYMKETKSICPGCSTGCNVKVSYNEEGVFRVKPDHNEKVNGYWMCDKGREIYKWVNKPVRLKRAITPGGKSAEPGKASQEAGKALKEVVSKHGVESVALVLTAQYTNEEIESAVKLFKNNLGGSQIYNWADKATDEEFADGKDFDGLLFRSDRNPNTKGLQAIFDENKVNQPWEDLENKISQGKIQFLIVAGPENQKVYSSLAEKTAMFAEAPQVVWLTACPNKFIEEKSKSTWQIPMRSFLEKQGHFTNHKGMVQKLDSQLLIVPKSLTLSQAFQLILGENPEWKLPENSEQYIKQNFFIYEKGNL